MMDKSQYRKLLAAISGRKTAAEKSLQDLRNMAAQLEAQIDRAESELADASAALELASNMETQQ